MKQVTINIYQFKELKDEAKKTALAKMRDINTNFGWWHFVYDAFYIIAKSVGVSVDLDKTYFTGFYHQGQGSSYTASVDTMKLIQAVKTMSWKEHAPLASLNFPAINIDRRILDLIQRGIIDTWAKVEPANRETSINVSTDLHYSYNLCPNYNRIDAELDKLEEVITAVCEELNHFLFTALRTEYEYLTSDAAVAETFEIYGHNFTVDGHPGFSIEWLAREQDNSDEDV